MIRTPARLVEIDGTVARLRVDADPGCTACAAGRGCGGGLLRPWRATPALIEVEAAGLPRDTHGGDCLELEIEPAALVRLAMLAYGIPLFSLTGAATLAELGLGWPDWAVAAAALTGLVAGSWPARRLSAAPWRIRAPAGRETAGAAR